MPEIPECLHRRYRALDHLIGELSSLPSQGSREEYFGNKHSNDPSIKLMCDFWNILKEDPNCNLSQAVKQRMGLIVRGSSNVFPQNVTCYMAGRSKDSEENRKKDTINKINNICCGSHTSNRSAACPMSTSREKREKAPDIPLTKALCNLKEAASLDKKCNVRVMELMETQNELKVQIHTLELREKEGVALLKEADCLWSCMEDEYKKKIAESIERQKELMKQLREVEKSNNKWRKNKKDLEDQLKSVCKCRQEITDKTMHKKNDLKIIEMEITDFNKRIATNKRLTDGSKQTLNNKKTVSDKKIADIATQVTKLKNTLSEAQKYKKNKEEEGKVYVKEARDDLQKICKLLLQKKMENEGLLAEKDGVLQEIDLLKQSCDQCKDKCQTKRNSIEDAIKKADQEIADYKFQCVRCHQCTDTSDARSLCSDCPKCKEQRECVTSEDHCDKDSSYDCVCVSVKEKFLNNVFENMYTVLERQGKTKPGKALANSIVKCLKNSRNGKLNTDTRHQVQEFVLNAVRKNLNLTIIGGAVKTRCEMDQDTYNQLMICLKQVKAEKPPKEDKGTVAKKEPCRRWGGSSECNCPGGARYCACLRRAPPPPREPTPCPPVLEKEEDPTEGTVVLCPHKESVGCGPVCTMHAVPSAVGTNVAAFKPSDSCATSGCAFKKNMRAAQCVLGPESLSSIPKTYMSSTPYVPDSSQISNKVTCKCDGASVNSCAYKRDVKQLKAVYNNSSTCTPRDRSMNDLYKKQIKLHNEPLMKHKQPNQLTTSISSKATELAKSICYIDNSFGKNMSLKKTRATQNKDSELNSKNILSEGTFNLQNSHSNNFRIEVKEKFTDIFDAKSSEDLNKLMTDKITDSEHSVYVYSKNTKDQLLDGKENASDPNTLKHHNQTQNETPSRQKVLYSSHISIKNDNNKCQSKQNLNILKSELLRKYEENRTTTVKLKTESGTYKTIKAPLTKTLSGNIAVEINKLHSEVEMDNRERNVALTRSGSGVIILCKNFDGFASAVIRKTASGSFLLVMAEPVFQSRKTVKRVTPSIERFYRVKIESDDYNTVEPPAVLKATHSHNYLVIPDKEYELQYKRTVDDLLDDSTEYYVNLKKTDSRNCVLQFDDFWEDNEPNALVVKTDSGDIKILIKRNALVPVDTGRKRTSMKNSSKQLSGILNTLPKSTDARKLNNTSNSSIFTKKSSSESNIYEKVKLFYSDHKDLLAEPSGILKMTNSGQYAVILDKESKITFINNLRSYLKNNFQGLVPIKKTESGEITIALNGEQTDKNHYGSLKITPYGNLYVIVDKDLMKDFTEEKFLHANSTKNKSVTDITSRHIIGKLKHPVNKAVTTTCNAMPEMECDMSKCTCSEIKLEKIARVHKCHQNDKIINFVSEVSGFNWRKVTNNPGTSDTKSLPHIIIKPLLHNLQANQQQCFYVIEAVCPFDENLSKWPEFHDHTDVQSKSNWDSLTFLPPQLPDFLRHFKYR